MISDAFFFFQILPKFEHLHPLLDYFLPKIVDSYQW